MKSESGITTTSIMIYIIAMVIVIGIIATITSFFYTNVVNLNENSSNIAEITKFQMYFLEEVKNANNAIAQSSDSMITFTTGNTFTFEKNAIYYNHIKICDLVKNMQFAIEEINHKQVIRVLLTIGENSEYTKTMSFVMATNV